MTIYFGEFEDLENMLSQWDIPEEQKERIRKLDILFAAYDFESYEGTAFVIFKENGHLYEVNDSHCSCSGLSGWKEEETSKEALLSRLNVQEEYRYGLLSRFYNELKAIIEAS
jgi:hypothetical protein